MFFKNVQQIQWFLRSQNGTNNESLLKSAVVCDPLRVCFVFTNLSDACNEHQCYFIFELSCNENSMDSELCVQGKKRHFEQIRF